MITLYSFGRRFGLPDASPFVIKAEVLLKMSGRPYRTDTRGFAKAPKGKLPYIDDGAARVADSTFIRWHLETTYGVDFDTGLDPYQKALAWTIERMCEDHLYWATMHDRWMVDDNFARGPRSFFAGIPPPLRWLVVARVRGGVRSALKSHGLGRHSAVDIERLAKRDLDALAALLEGKSYLMGATPCGADATVFAFVASASCPHFDSRIGEYARGNPTLAAYVDRCRGLWFPEPIAEAPPADT